MNTSTTSDPAPKTRIVVIGATSSIAEHCCRLWVQGGPIEIILVARDWARAERIAEDLRGLDAQAEVSVETMDFLSPPAITAAVARWTAGRPLDLALIAHGVLSPQQPCQDDISQTRRSIEVNGLSPVLFAEALAGAMGRAGHGTIGMIGSIAGDRGRRANYVYGASKALMDRYAQGLRHRFAGSGVRIVLIKPGPTDTPMAAPYKAQGRRLAPVEQVACGTVEAMRRGTPVAYLPRRWRYIMLVARALPDFLFNRLNF
ncbi:SDR family NAD(P)-dependent oxidoreductase [Reyranella sp.]|uniref:SDR family NAD(P)-dependent oxidoreductase n=1 Tax=Reyranella sp. TaxID=1929291 RepID=UPI003BA9F21A